MQSLNEISSPQEFPVKRKKAYFNNASYTPMSRSAIQAIQSKIEEYSTEGPDDQYYLSLKEGANDARRKLAKLIGAKRPESIIFSESATQSINMIANGFRFRKGDAVIIRGWSTEHPSNFIPWKYYADTKGVSLRDLDYHGPGLVDPSQLDTALKETRACLVVISHVLYNYGSILPAKELVRVTHERGARFFLDISQSVVNAHVDLSGFDCDYAAGTAAKWLCGPLGLGFTYVRDEEALSLIDPLNFGANSCAYNFDGSFKPVGLPARLQEGFRNWAYTYGLAAAIDLISRFGVDSVRERGRKLAESIIENVPRDFDLLSSSDRNIKTNIVAFKTGQRKPIEIAQKLAKNNIIVAERELGAGRFLRISPHFYNDEEEVSKLVDALRN